MTWEEIRQQYPHQWLLVEAVQAHSAAGKRIIDQLAVLNTFADSPTALTQYSQLHRQWPEREYFVLHTDRELLDIKERHWLGIRPAFAQPPNEFAGCFASQNTLKRVSTRLP